MTELRDAGSTGTSLGNRSSSKDFKASRILYVAVPIALIVILCAAFFVTGGDDWLANLMKPALAPASVQVLYRGKPVTEGFLETKPVGGGQGAMGFPDDNGWFTLRTQIEGRYEEGAYVGEHKVAARIFEPAQGLTPPKPLVPIKYTAIGNTPLVIQVVKNSDENRFTLELEEDPNQPAPEEEEGKDEAEKTPADPDRPQREPSTSERPEFLKDPSTRQKDDQ